MKIKFKMRVRGWLGSSTHEAAPSAHPRTVSGKAAQALRAESRCGASRCGALASVLIVSAVATFAHAQDRSRPSRYRDGADWALAERTRGPAPTRSRSGEALTAVRVQLRGETLRGFVGRRALLQLTPEAWRDRRRLLRQHALRAVTSARTGEPGSGPLEAGALAADGGGARPQPAAADAELAWSVPLRLLLVEGRAGEDGLQLAVRLSQAAGVESAVPDLYIRRKRTEFAIPPDDPRYGGQRYLSRLDIEEAWQINAGDPGTSIVVVDDGCDLSHPDLVDAFKGGYDAIDDDDDASYSPNEQGNEHGTACSGIIAATGNNGLGIAGVCPQCSLYCVRLFATSHSLIPLSADIAAFQYALDVGAAVISNSWGFAEPGPVPGPLRGAIQEVLSNGRGGRGAVVVFAAGNENREIGGDELAAISGVINVGAINIFDEAAPFSNRGASVAVTAPTGSLTTDIQGADGADRSDYTNLFGGTSAACPVVAGVAGLVLSAAPELSGAELRATLIATVREAPFATPDPSGHDPLYGYGIVDPARALRTVLGLPEPAPEPDAGAPHDAGETARDAEVADGGERPRADAKDDGGCSSAGAAAGDARASGLLVCLAGLLLRMRRRRARVTQNM